MDAFKVKYTPLEKIAHVLQYVAIALSIEILLLIAVLLA